MFIITSLIIKSQLSAWLTIVSLIIVVVMGFTTVNNTNLMPNLYAKKIFNSIFFSILFVNFLSVLFFIFKISIIAKWMVTGELLIFTSLTFSWAILCFFPYLSYSKTMSKITSLFVNYTLKKTQALMYQVIKPEEFDIENFEAFFAKKNPIVN